MTRQTLYLVQPFVAGKGGSLKAEKALQSKTAADAMRTAERLASSKLGVVAYSTSGDPDLGEYDERPAVLFKAGRVPPEFED